MTNHTDHASVSFSTAQIINEALNNLLEKKLSPEEYLKVVDNATAIASKSWDDQKVSTATTATTATTPADTATVSNSEVGYHVGHCCGFHGCKYGEVGCPVVLGYNLQAHPCEECQTVEDIDSEIYYLQGKIHSLQKERNFALHRDSTN